MLPEQAVTTGDRNSDDSNESTEDDGRAEGARDDDLDLDALLEQSRDEDDSKPEQTSESEVSADVAARLERLEKETEANRRKDAQKAADAAINSAATEIKTLSDELAHVPERAIKGYLYAFAEEKPDLLKIFTNRDRNPKAWNDVKKAMAKEIAKDLGGAGSNDVAAGVQAVADAVRGVSHKSTTDDSLKVDPRVLAGMSNAEFEAHKAKLRASEAGAAR